MNLHGLRVLRFPKSANAKENNKTFCSNKYVPTHREVKGHQEHKKKEDLKYRNSVTLSEEMTACCSNDNMAVFLKRQKSESTGNLSHISMKDKNQLRKRTSSHSDIKILFKNNYHFRDNKIKYRRKKRLGQPVTRSSARNYDIDFKPSGDHFNFRANTNYLINRLSHRTELHVRNPFRNKSPYAKHKRNFSPPKPEQINKLNQASHRPLRLLTSTYPNSDKRYSADRIKEPWKPEYSLHLCKKECTNTSKPTYVTNDSNEDSGIVAELRSLIANLLGKNNISGTASGSRPSNKPCTCQKHSSRKSRIETRKLEQKCKNLRLYQDGVDDTERVYNRTEGTPKSSWSFERIRKMCCSSSTSKHNLYSHSPHPSAFDERARHSERPMPFHTTHDEANRRGYCCGTTTDSISKGNYNGSDYSKPPRLRSKNVSEHSSSNFLLDKVVRCCCNTVVDTVKRLFKIQSCHSHYLPTRQHNRIPGSNHKNSCLCRNQGTVKACLHCKGNYGAQNAYAANVDKNCCKCTKSLNTKSFHRCDKRVSVTPSSLELIKQFLFEKTRCFPATKKESPDHVSCVKNNKNTSTSRFSREIHLTKYKSDSVESKLSKCIHKTTRCNRKTSIPRPSVEKLRKICSCSANRRLIRRGSNHIPRRLVFDASARVKATCNDCDQHSISPQKLYPPNDALNTKQPQKYDMYTHQTRLYCNESGKCVNCGRPMKMSDMRRSTCVYCGSFNTPKVCDSKISPIFIRQMDPFKKSLEFDSLSRYPYKQRSYIKRPRLFQENENEEKICVLKCGKTLKPVKRKTCRVINKRLRLVRPPTNADNLLSKVLYGITAVLWSPCLLLLGLGWILSCPIYFRGRHEMKHNEKNVKAVFPGSCFRKGQQAQCMQPAKLICNKKSDNRGLNSIVKWSTALLNDVATVANAPFSSLRGNRQKPTCDSIIFTKLKHREPGLDCLYKPSDKGRGQRRGCCCSRSKLHCYNCDRIVQNMQCKNRFHGGYYRNRHICPARKSKSMKLIEQLQQSKNVLSKCLQCNKKSSRTRLFNDSEFTNHCSRKETISQRVGDDNGNSYVKSLGQSSEINAQSSQVPSKEYVDNYTSTKTEIVRHDLIDDNGKQLAVNDSLTEKHSRCHPLHLIQSVGSSNQKPSNKNCICRTIHYLPSSVSSANIQLLPKAHHHPHSIRTTVNVHKPPIHQPITTIRPSPSIRPPPNLRPLPSIRPPLSIRTPVNVHWPPNTRRTPLPSIGSHAHRPPGWAQAQNDHPLSNIQTPCSCSSAKNRQNTNNPNTQYFHPTSNIQTNHRPRSIQASQSVHSSTNTHRSTTKPPVPSIHSPEVYQPGMRPSHQTVHHGVKSNPVLNNKNSQFSQANGPTKYINKNTMPSPTTLTPKNEVFNKNLPIMLTSEQQTQSKTSTAQTKKTAEAITSTEQEPKKKLKKEAKSEANGNSGKKHKEASEHKPKKPKEKPDKIRDKKPEMIFEKKPERILEKHPEKETKKRPEIKADRNIEQKPEIKVEKVFKNACCNCKTNAPESNNNKKNMLKKMVILWKCIRKTVNKVDADMWSDDLPCKNISSSGQCRVRSQMLGVCRRTRRRKPPSGTCVKMCIMFLYCATFLCWSPLLCCFLICWKIPWI